MLKQKFTLAYTNFNKPFTIYCDVSSLHIMLTHPFKDGEHSLVYISHIFTETVRDYDFTEMEYLALLTIAPWNELRT